MDIQKLDKYETFTIKKFKSFTTPKVDSIGDRAKYMKFLTIFHKDVVEAIILGLSDNYVVADVTKNKLLEFRAIDKDKYNEIFAEVMKDRNVREDIKEIIELDLLELTTETISEDAKVITTGLKSKEDRVPYIAFSKLNKLKYIDILEYTKIISDVLKEGQKNKDVRKVLLENLVLIESNKKEAGDVIIAGLSDEDYNVAHQVTAKLIELKDIDKEECKKVVAIIKNNENVDIGIKNLISLISLDITKDNIPEAVAIIKSNINDLYVYESEVSFRLNELRDVDIEEYKNAIVDFVKEDDEVVYTITKKIMFPIILSLSTMEKHEIFTEMFSTKDSEDNRIWDIDKIKPYAEFINGKDEDFISAQLEQQSKRPGFKKEKSIEANSPKQL